MKTLITLVIVALFLSISATWVEAKPKILTISLSSLMTEEEIYNLADSSGLISISSIKAEIRSEGFFLVKEETKEKIKNKAKSYDKIITPRIIISDESLLIYTYKDSYGERHVSISVAEYVTIADTKKIIFVVAG